MNKKNTELHLARLEPALETLGSRLASVGVSWIVGGSTGLLLHGVALGTEPRDLDLYADHASIAVIHEALSVYATDVPQISETGMYRSNLSHYRVCDVQVELVGSLEVERGTARYRVETEAVMRRYAMEVKLREARMLVMPLVHELLFNVLRERPDRYIPIAKAIRLQPIARHQELWRELARRNPIGEPFLGTVRSLLPELVEQGGPA